MALKKKEKTQALLKDDTAKLQKEKKELENTIVELKKVRCSGMIFVFSFLHLVFKARILQNQLQFEVLHLNWCFVLMNLS